MNRKFLLLIALMIWCFHTSFGNIAKIMGDSTSCLLYFELSQNEDEQYVVSLLPDTTWAFPRNIVSTAQITIRVPTGVFEVDDPISLIDNVSFFKSGRDNAPVENPQFDYISFSLGTQGTTRIPFEKGEKVALFSFENTSTCPSGVVSLMDNFSDPFYPPNSKQSNAGQQMTVSGYGAPDLPIGIIGEGIYCNPEEMNPINPPVDTLVDTPVDTLVDTPVDTPVDTLVDTPVDTTGSTPPIPSTDLSVQIATQVVSCSGGNDGIIVLKVDNGLLPYTYSWSTGATTASIENLAVGVYMVTIQDATGFFIERTISITEVAPLELLILTEDISSTTNNGSVAATVIGGTAPYSYEWSTGATNNEINNLSEGEYSLTVTDAYGCTTAQTVDILSSSQCPRIDLDLGLKTPSCVGGDDGQILVTPLNGVTPFTYNWGNGQTTNFIDEISAGSYMVTVTDAAGCTMAASVMLPEPLALSVDLVTGNDQISASVSGGAPPYMYTWSNGATSASIENVPAGTYTITITDSFGCSQIATTSIANPDPDPDPDPNTSCNLDIFSNMVDQVSLASVPCSDKGALCLPIEPHSISNYTIYLDNVIYTGETKGCQFKVFFAYSFSFFSNNTSGNTYNLKEWTVNGSTYSGTFNTIEALVDSMNLWDPTGNWALQSSIAIIQGGNSNSSYGGMVIEFGDLSTILDVNSNQTPLASKISFKPGLHELVVVKNSTSCADTLMIDFPCHNTTTQDTTILLTMLEGAQSTICLNNIFGEGITVSANTCPSLSGTVVGTDFNTSSNCLTISGLQAGMEEICHTITTTDGSTLNLTILPTVTPLDNACIEFPTDTLFTFTPNCMSIQACLDLPYSILSNATITSNGESFTGEIASCENGNSLLSFPSVGPYNLEITYDNSCTFQVVVMVACDSDEVIEQTIEIASSDVVPINIPGLSDVFVSIENICPEKSGEHVIFETIDQTNFVLYTGIGIGTDTACIVACDIFGFCDTITLIFHVEDFITPPPIHAENDTASIRLNGSIVLNVLENDNFQSIDTIYIVENPSFGQVLVNPDATLTYISQTGYCDDDQPDIFSYAICKGESCDTATVAITVNCFINRGLNVYTGMSPNGDGINDSFLVEGIENYPNNSVSIYNRWGNMIFYQKGYKNEWKATWSEEKRLPDGTYFYIIDLGEDTRALKGFLQVRR